jgi:hypothetical protein
MPLLLVAFSNSVYTLKNIVFIAAAKNKMKKNYD